MLHLRCIGGLVNHGTAHGLLGLLSRGRRIDHFLTFDEDVVDPVVRNICREGVMTGYCESLELLDVCRPIDNQVRSRLL